MAALARRHAPARYCFLAPDEVRLRQLSRMLDSLPLQGFLALEGDAARAACGEARIWRTPGSARTALNLEEALTYVPSGGELPEPAPRRTGIVASRPAP